MNIMEDLTGKRFGRWTVLAPAQRRNRAMFWECQCDCGTVRDVKENSLTHGKSHSCGCLMRDTLIMRETTHGQSKTRLYKIWKGMRKRCNNSNDTVYKFYGGRGIVVCDEWNDFEAFYKWSYENGYDDTAKGHECSIDRINSNGPYSPDNCRWVDNNTQHTNTRRNRYITIDGETHILRDWSNISGVSVPTIIRRLQCGWDTKDAIFIKANPSNRYKAMIEERESMVD